MCLLQLHNADAKKKVHEENNTIKSEAGIDLWRWIRQFLADHLSISENAFPHVFKKQNMSKYTTSVVTLNTHIMES